MERTEACPEATYQTFRLLERVAELLHVGEVSLSAASYLLGISLMDAKGLSLNWRLLPCTVHPLIARYCGDDIKTLLTINECNACANREDCAAKITGPE